MVVPSAQLKKSLHGNRAAIFVALFSVMIREFVKCNELLYYTVN